MAAELTLPETLSRASPEGELQTSADSGPLETIELVLCRLQQPLLGARASRLSLFCHQLRAQVSSTSLQKTSSCCSPRSVLSWLCALPSSILLHPSQRSPHLLALHLSPLAALESCSSHLRLLCRWAQESFFHHPRLPRCH